jgi:hypothetical protein
MVSFRSSIAALTLALAGCDAGFASEEVVVDLRLLGIIASPPEIVTPLDPATPEAISVDDLGEVEVCALIADPGASRRLAWRMRACPPEGSGRCDGDAPSLIAGEGVIEDPEEAAVPAVPCGRVSGGPELVAILTESVRADDLAGFGNVAVMISLTVWPEGEDSATAEFGEKDLRYAPMVPEGRVANTNPTLDALEVAREPTSGRGDDFDLPIGRCVDGATFPVAPGERVQVLPRETAGAREDYLVPTFEGGERRLTENLSYQFYATAGNWSRFSSGGQRDSAGNQPPLDSRWTAPDDLEAIGDGLDVQLWIVVRDERGGQAWYPSCAHVAR